LADKKYLLCIPQISAQEAICKLFRLIFTRQHQASIHEPDRSLVVVKVADWNLLDDEPDFISIGCNYFELVSRQPGEVPDLETSQVNFLFALVADDEIYHPPGLTILGKQLYAFGV
jgi:hypothetical protein